MMFHSIFSAISPSSITDLVYTCSISYVSIQDIPKVKSCEFRVSVKTEKLRQKDQSSETVIDNLKYRPNCKHIY